MNISIPGDCDFFESTSIMRFMIEDLEYWNKHLINNMSVQSLMDSRYWVKVELLKEMYDECYQSGQMVGTFNPITTNNLLSCYTHLSKIYPRRLTFYAKKILRLKAKAPQKIRKDSGNPREVVYSWGYDHANERLLSEYNVNTDEYQKYAADFNKCNDELFRKITEIASACKKTKKIIDFETEYELPRRVLSSTWYFGTIECDNYRDEKRRVMNFVKPLSGIVTCDDWKRTYYEIQKAEKLATVRPLKESDFTNLFDEDEKNYINFLAMHDWFPEMRNTSLDDELFDIVRFLPREINRLTDTAIRAIFYWWDISNLYKMEMFPELKKQYPQYKNAIKEYYENYKFSSFGHNEEDEVDAEKVDDHKNEQSDTHTHEGQESVASTHNMTINNYYAPGSCNFSAGSTQNGDIKSE